MIDPATQAGAGGQPAPEPPEFQNLAAKLDEQEARDIAELVIREYDQDEMSRKPWLEMNALYTRLFFQIDKPVNPPFEAGQYSEESLPVLALAVNQFHSRAFRAMFPGRSFIKGVPAEGVANQSDLDRADRVGRHMNWQLMVRDRTYKKNKDALLQSVAVHGAFFTKTYYDHLRRRNVIENVRAEDLVIPYGIGPRPLNEIERKTQIIWMSVNRTRLLKSKGYFIDEGRPWNQGASTDTQKANEQVEGLQPSNAAEDHPCKILEQHRLLDLDGDGLAEPYIATVDVASRKLLRLSIRYETDPMGNPVNDKEPVEYFTDYMFMPNPDGAYGLGMGTLLGQLNQSMNKLIRQILDAGTLANVGNSSGFVSSALGLGKGDLKLELGKFKSIEASAEDIQRAIFQFKFPGPAAVLGNMMEVLHKFSERLGSATEALTGQTDTVQQPTTVLALIDQGLQVFSTVYERLTLSVEDELRKVYQLNARYLDKAEYFTVLDYDGPKRVSVSPTDYRGDMQVQLISDPRNATEQQRQARANLEWQFVSQNPLVVNNPMALWFASRQYWEAIGAQNADQIFPKPIKDPQRVDDPNLENMAALLPVPTMPGVFLDQNHLLHMKAHEAFMQDPQYGTRITPEGMRQLQIHIQTHVAFLYGVTETSLMGMMNGQVGQGAVEAPPGDGIVPLRPEPPVPPPGAMAAGGANGAGGPPEGPA